RSTLANDPMNLPRIEICNDDTIEQFAHKLERRAEPVTTKTKLNHELAPDTPVGFRAEEIRSVRPNIEPVHPDYVQALARRLDALVGEFVMLQTQLLKLANSPITLQKRLTTLFAQPVTGKTSRLVKPGDEIGPGIFVNFDSNTELTLSIEPKADHSLSPDTYLN